MRFMKIILILALSAGAGLVAAVAGSGVILSLGVHAKVGPPPRDLAAAETIDIPSRSGNKLRAWFLSGVPGQGAALLLHGIRADRRQLVERMRFLSHAGYSVLAMDFRAHGESTGNQITFGYLESLDALSAVEYLHRRLPAERIGVIGISLGGAAALLGPKPLPVDALVLESVYPCIESAIGNRIEARTGSAWLGRAVAKIYLLVMPAILHIQPESLRPIDRIHEIREPVLVVSGTADLHTKIEETGALYANAPEPREIWKVPGAAHVDLQNFAGIEYNTRILEFFARYLPNR